MSPARQQQFEYGRSEGQFRPDYDDSWWLEAEVPGEVHAGAAPGSP